MLGNFIYSNPTKLYFGEDAKGHFAEALKSFVEPFTVVSCAGCRDYCKSMVRAAAILLS